MSEARIVASSPPVPEHCLVLGVARPTADSDIRFEVAIPVGEGWNGRYQQVGNGGFAGSIPEPDIRAGLAAGNAVAGTDDGHTGTVTDASWAYGHPEKVIDFGYRAVKETRDAAQAIVRAYTGRTPRFSYFTGCSDGGREGLMEAQRYPEDFDGIVAGAPANDFTRVMVAMAWNVRALLETPASYIPAAKLGAIQGAVLRVCGARDGVIEDPLACRFDPGMLRCPSGDGEACLTDAQIAALRRIYGGPVSPRSGVHLEPGLEPGGEAEPGGWPEWVVGAGPGEAGGAGHVRFATSFFRFAVFGDPAYDLSRLDFDQDVVTADVRVGRILDATSPDLGAFRQHGGKLLQYHGWADPVIPPRDSIAYHAAVQAALGDVSGFYRLFMAPGMLHCEGGPGFDVLPTMQAIATWVEQGRAPDRLIAAKRPMAPGQVEPTRPLCPFPLLARWDTKGDSRRAESYVCEPARHP